MKTSKPETRQFGDFVAAIFDEATLFCSSPKEVSRLATLTVTHMFDAARQYLEPQALILQPVRIRLRSRKQHG